MDAKQFQVEFDWVLNVLNSCETLDQVQVTHNLYVRLLVKWSSGLNSPKIKALNILFVKLEKFQINKIKKSCTQINKRANFLNKL